MRALWTLLLLLPLVASAASSGKKIQCWTDDKGHRACGDYVPPQYAKQEVEILNQQGLVVDKKAREKTVEEQAEADRKARDEIQAQTDARAKASYDRFLLDTYSNTKEMEKARDIRVQTLDSRIALAQKVVVDNQNTVTELRARTPAKAANESDAKQLAAASKANERLNKQIASYEKTLADNTAGVEAMKKEREQTLAKFTEDIRRWNELKGNAAAAAPAAASAVKP